MERKIAILNTEAYKAVPKNWFSRFSSVNFKQTKDYFLRSLEEFNLIKIGANKGHAEFRAVDEGNK